MPWSSPGRSLGRACMPSVPESARRTRLCRGFPHPGSHGTREIFNLIGTPNQVESVAAFFEKRTPNYTEVGRP